MCASPAGALSHLLTSPEGDARRRPAGGGRARLSSGLSEAATSRQREGTPLQPLWQGTVLRPAQLRCHLVAARSLRASASCLCATVIVTASARGLQRAGHPMVRAAVLTGTWTNVPSNCCIAREDSKPSGVSDTGHVDGALCRPREVRSASLKIYCQKKGTNYGSHDMSDQYN